MVGCHGVTVNAVKNSKWLFICIPISDTTKNLESNFYASFFLTGDFFKITREQ